jgi:exosortase/archaeosortase family protein
MIKNLQKTITPLLWRVIVFLCLFVAVSGAIGPRIISSDILFRDGFGIYGGFGKAAIFGIIAFALISRHNKSQIKLQPWQPKLLIWLVASGICFALAWIGVSGLLADSEPSLCDLTLAHGGLVLCVGFAAICCFGIDNIVLIWKKHQRQIMVSIIIAAAFYLFLLVVYALWQPLASIVLSGVTVMLSTSGPVAVLVPPHTLMFDRFGITVAEYCSGIESIALFSGLYAIVGLLDWSRLNKKRYFLVFLFALLLLFGLNIIRVYGLIMAGYYINQEIAFSLFHTYAGLVFFVLYSAIFWMIAYKHLLVKKAHQADKSQP